MVKRHVPGLAVLSILLLAGCAIQPPAPPDLFWPSPPEEPRIAYTAAYRGELDYKTITILDKLFGTVVQNSLPKPYGVAAAGGKVYVSDHALGGVMVIDPAKRVTSLIGNMGENKLLLPMGLTATPDGMLYVADAKAMRINVYDQAGKLTSFIGRKNELVNPTGVAVNSELGRVYVVDSRAHDVVVYSTGGELLFRIGSRGKEDGQFNFPVHLAIDRRNGNLVVADAENNRIQVFDRDGKFLSKFGQVGDAPGNFVRMKGVGVDSEGHIYVNDAAFNLYQVFDEAGQLLIFIGGPGISWAQFNLPMGMFIDEADTIYVVDQFNARVQVFQYLSERWKKEHPEEYKKYILPKDGALPPGGQAGDKQQQK